MPALSNSRADPRNEIAAAISTLLSMKTLAGGLVGVDAIFLFEQLPTDLAARFDHLIEVDTLLAQDLSDAIECLHGNNLLRRYKDTFVGLCHGDEVTLLQAEPAPHSDRQGHLALLLNPNEFSLWYSHAHSESHTF